MSAPVRVLVFAGSAREASFNKKLARVAAEAATKAGADVTYVDLAECEMPVYNGDLEAASGVPETALRLKKLLAAHDALIIAAPEYNGSITPLLKNTIDWLSRPSEGAPGAAIFKGKVAAIMATSGGMLGGLRGLVHLRAILTNLHVIVIPAQRAIGKAGSVFDATGAITDDAVQESIDKIAVQLVDTAARLRVS
jgi:NAD(P)H-dependent FMN reductase